jgi:hypothetical protein
MNPSISEDYHTFKQREQGEAQKYVGGTIRVDHTTGIFVAKH